MYVTPISAKTRATRSGSSEMLIPNAVRTSFAPDFELAALFPCLMTGTPAAETTIAAIDDTLMTPIGSAPEPTMSTASVDTSSGRAAAKIASRKPTTSSTDSPLARRATRKAASRASLTSPFMMSVIAREAPATVRDRPSSRSLRVAVQLSFGTPLPYRSRCVRI